MAKFIVLLVATIALTQARLVRRDAEVSTPLQDLQKHAEEFQKVFADSLQSISTSKNTQDVQKAFKDGSDSLLQQLSALTASLQSAMADANGKVKEALEQAKNNVQRSADELRRAHPDIEKQAAALSEKVQAAVQNTIQETQKLAKEVASNIEQTNAKLAPKIKAAYDDFVKQAEQVQKNVHEAANKQ
ncbi:unnamed protein product [Parnassius apollo]|uniref:(apollo) hypothetical protein n=1 Tax=Parnassius apollo TaxID=110799 RepID=A0A8S3XY77_PARAO|nr:unnamed protein product [Parnassius apollo]